MANRILMFSEYLNYPFIKYALSAGVLIALCSSLLGVPLVLKRYSFIGDGLSHVAFGALSIATILRIKNEMIVVLPITIICAILMLCGARNSKQKGDATLAMVSVGTLAIGYLFLNLFPVSSNISGDVCGALFGSASILTLSKTDILLCLIMSIVVIGIFFLFYDKFFSITFDESFGRAAGINTAFYKHILSVTTAVIIVLAMTLVGSLLTSAMIVFPSVSSMRIFKSFRGVVICSAILSVICAILGIFTSILFSTPVGCTIVIANIFTFLIFSIAEKLLKC